MQEELKTLEAKYQSLQKLVGELLVTNHKLRQEVAQLEKKDATLQATHPQPHPAH